jgi:exopolysaccharide biosynthesis protein
MLAGVPSATSQCLPALAFDTWTRDTLATGVVWYASTDSVFGRPQAINVLETTRPAALNIVAASQLTRDRATVQEFAEAVDALFAVNGGFAHGGVASMNSGMVKIDGHVLPHLEVEPQELRFVGSGAVGFDSDGGVQYRIREGNRWTDDWPEVRSALAAGHMLLIDGQIESRISAEDYALGREEGHAGLAHPRTAICSSREGKTFLATIDGRHPGNAEGMTLNELAQFLQSLGCVDGLNLDGGGSTTMWIRSRGVVNHPSDNGLFDHEGSRLVRTAIFAAME